MSGGILGTPQRFSKQSSGGSRSAGELGDYLADYQGFAAGSSIELSDGQLRRLPDQPCKYAMIANWNVVNNAASFAFKAPSADQLYENAGDEIYYGFNGIIVAQLFPSQNTGLLPINNLKHICLRTRPGDAITVWYAWFW